jgi:hypothetical protein
MLVDKDTGKWVVTVFFDHEPSRIYGLFDSEEEAMAWAESDRDSWDAMVVQQLWGRRYEHRKKTEEGK